MNEAGIEAGTVAGIEVMIEVAIDLIEIGRSEVGIDLIGVAIDLSGVAIEIDLIGVETENGDVIAIEATGIVMPSEIAGGVTVTTGTKTTGTTAMTDAPGNVVGIVGDLEVDHEVTGGAGERVKNQKSDLSRKWVQRRS